jgi:hypothetical protein
VAQLDPLILGEAGNKAAGVGLACNASLSEVRPGHLRRLRYLGASRHDGRGKGEERRGGVGECEAGGTVCQSAISHGGKRGDRIASHGFDSRAERQVK